MKNFTLIALAICLAACSPSGRKRVVAADTVFLHREMIGGAPYKVFIEKHRSSVWYRNLLDFTYDEYAEEDFRNAYKRLKHQEPKPLKIFDTGDFPHEWLPIERYKGKYYLYYPSEWGNIDRRIITDSTVVWWSMEVTGPQPFSAFKKIDTRTYEFSTRTPDPQIPAGHQIIHIIDPKNNIAIWEDTNRPEAYRYGLYIAKANARNFEMIVSDYSESKMPEFVFDKVDYKVLLKQAAGGTN